jgi:hypothetical protein
MTDEPNKAGGVRQSVMAALLAALLFLSALAFLAGCKSEPPITGPRVGYLHFNDRSVTFVEWTLTGRKLEGQISALHRKPDGKVKVTMFLFYGKLDGDKVSLTLNSSGNAQDGFHSMDKTIIGALGDDTLTLPPVNGADGDEPVVFRRATPVEFADATAYLK